MLQSVGTLGTIGSLPTSFVINARQDVCMCVFVCVYVCVYVCVCMNVTVCVPTSFVVNA